MLNFERLGNITTELSSNLVRSLMVPGSLKNKAGKPQAERAGAPRPAAETGKLPVMPGTVLLFGEGPLSDDGIVRMIHLAGGRASRFVVAAVAMTDSQTSIDMVRAFTRYGCKHVDVVEITTRERADAADWCDQISSADAILVIADDPIKARSILVDTRCKATFEAMVGAGKVVAGAGAGALVLCDQMVLGQGEEILAGGTALVGRLILATALSQESMVRLLQAVGSFQGSLYLGAALGRSTGLMIRDGEARVVGEANVTVMDARDCVPVNQGDEEEPEAAAGVVCGLKVHHLAPGYGINLRSRRPMAPSEKPSLTPAAGD